MSYLPQVPPDAKTASLFEGMRAMVGFIPNFYRAQTQRPDFIEAEAQMMETILIREGALTRPHKEYLFLACSGANLSTYCVTAHCEIVRMLGLEGPEPEQIAIDYTATNLPVPVKALLAFALKLNEHPTRVDRHDIDALRTYGFNDQQIMEAVIVVGFAKFANFVGFGLGTVPDFDSTKIVFPDKENVGVSSPF